MATRTKPYDSFGPYILFKKLETDSLGDLWRAGRIDGGHLGPTLALRRFTGGGHRDALVATVDAASEIIPQLTGTSFAKEQAVGNVDHTPFVSWDYQGGRSLRYIIDRARGGNGAQPNPLPLDQAIVIAEKVALSLATTADLRDGAGQRLWHGALLPQFVWISDDGEIRVAGQLLGAGIMASLHDQKVYGEVARYFPPEARTADQPRNTDVYSMGALLFLLVTGQEPPDAATASAFVPAVRAAKTMTGQSIPDDIRVILDKSFQLDPAMRFQSIGDMKQAITALAHGGKYSGTTFNLAFYLSHLLKKEMEAEAAEREKESKVNVAPYLEAPKPAAAPVVAAAPAAPAATVVNFSAAEEKSKSKAPLAIAAAVILGGLGFGAWYMMKKPAPATTAKPVQAQALPVQKPVELPAPLVVSGGATDTAAAAAATTDTAAQQKMFEDAVRAKVQAEMMKLQEEFLTELKKSQPKNVPAAAPVQTVSAPAPAEERPSVSAAQLDQSRRESQTQQQQAVQTATQAPAPAPTQTVAPAPQQAAPQVATQTPAPVQQQPTVREGDVVGIGDLDQMPRPVRLVQPQYPPVARAQRVAATVILSVFINENGDVTDVRVLRGEPRFGISDSAVRAMKATKFSSPIKDGKRVKTWMPQQIDFKP